MTLQSSNPITFVELVTVKSHSAQTVFDNLGKVVEVCSPRAGVGISITTLDHTRHQ